MDWTFPNAAIVATPLGFVLLWWRMSVVEREVKLLREDKHANNNAIARLQGATDVMVTLVQNIINGGK